MMEEKLRIAETFASSLLKLLLNCYDTYIKRDEHVYVGSLLLRDNPPSATQITYVPKNQV